MERSLTELERSLSEALEKKAKAKGHVKKLGAFLQEVQEAMMHRSSTGWKRTASKVESAGLWRKLRTTLLCVTKVANLFEQRVVVSPFVESEMLVALETQVVALRCQAKAMKDEIEVSAEAVVEISKISR